MMRAQTKTNNIVLIPPPPSPTQILLSTTSPDSPSAQTEPTGSQRESFRDTCNSHSAAHLYTIIIYLLYAQISRLQQNYSWVEAVETYICSSHKAKKTDKIHVKETFFKSWFCSKVGPNTNHQNACRSIDKPFQLHINVVTSSSKTSKAPHALQHLYCEKHAG